MMAWIEENPYKWHDPIARDLHQRLVDTFYEPDEVRNLVRAAKYPDSSTIDFRKSIRMVWVDTLDRATQQGGLATLLRYIVDHTSAAEGVKTYIARLLADEKPAATPTAGAWNAPAVPPIQESLLFQMDLTEEVGEVQSLVDAIGRVMKWRSSVCHLLVVATFSCR
jgi:Effector-associated domain 1